MNRWKVVKRYNRWRVLDGGAWHETHDTLAQAHTAATQYAVIDECFKAGGLTRLKDLERLAHKQLAQQFAEHHAHASSRLIWSR
jgi:hypothetical protein